MPHPRKCTGDILALVARAGGATRRPSWILAESTQRVGAGKHHDASNSIGMLRQQIPGRRTWASACPPVQDNPVDSRQRDADPGKTPADLGMLNIKATLRRRRMGFDRRVSRLAVGAM
jgi:hypothetical protein